MTASGAIEVVDGRRRRASLGGHGIERRPRPRAPSGLSRRSAGGSHPAPSRAITSGHQRPHTTEPHDSTAGFDRVSEGATVLPHTLRVAGAVIGAGCSGCDWGQGDRRSSAGQPAERPTGGQSPRSSSPRPCRTWGGGYRASSAVSGDGRRTACRLTRFDSVRAVIDLWARRQDGFSFHSEWLRSSRR